MTNLKMNLFAKLESVQDKATLATTGGMQGISRDKICQELGLDIVIEKKGF